MFPGLKACSVGQGQGWAQLLRAHGRGGGAGEGGTDQVLRLEDRQVTRVARWPAH